MNAIKWVIWVLVLGSMACTERNPEYCGDGTCIDPAKPYCDFNGDFGGKPGTCIAVSCNAGEFAMCRGDSAISCTSMGNNYETTQCSLGCDAASSGCKQCTANNQCTAGQLCDLGTFSCRGCKSDDECDSKVCDLEAGTCVAESNVLYASPNGPGGTAEVCTLAQPCSVDRAVILAANSMSSPIVRMLPGTYSSQLKMNVINRSVKVVATGATIFVLGQAAIVVEAGATLEVRGIASTSEGHVVCGRASTTGPISTAKIIGATLTSAPNTTAFDLGRCSLSVFNTTLTGSGLTILGTQNDASFVADRFYAHRQGAQPSSVIAAGSNTHVKFVNSVLEDTDIVVFFNDTSAPSSDIRLAYTTVYNSDGIEMCASSQTAYIKQSLENSIVAAAGTFDALKNASSGNCTITSSILTHQNAAQAGATIADPQFVNLGGYDFHLKATSPAVDAATPGTLTTTYDFDGKSRPVGTAADIGAFEYRP